MQAKVRPRKPRPSQTTRCVVTGMVALMMLAARLQAQAGGGTVTGQVTDAATKLPVPQATVQIAGTRLGVTTDENGRYRLAAVPAGSDTIVVH